MREVLPVLQRDTRVLFDLYYNNSAVRAKDIKTAFGISGSTAGRVVRCAYRYARANGEKIYRPPTVKIVPVELLYRMYGWDIERITKKMKVLQRMEVKR